MPPGGATPTPGGRTPHKGITWDRRWDRVFDPDLTDRTAAGSPARRLNTSFNCLDRHVAAGRGAQPALIWDSAMDRAGSRRFTYAALLARVAKCAGALATLGRAGAATGW